jgi:hypothetical protein
MDLVALLLAQWLVQVEAMEHRADRRRERFDLDAHVHPPPN